MRAALPGTHHTTTVDRCEHVILSAVEHCPGVVKLKPGRIVWTGPRSRRLHLSCGRHPRIIEGSLFIGAARRFVRIYLTRGVDLATLQTRLEVALDRYDVSVKVEPRVVEAGSHVRGVDGQEIRGYLGEDRRMALIPENSWMYCERIYEGVKQVKQLMEQEEFLELQLEEIRDQKRNLQGKTCEIFAQILSALPGSPGIAVVTAPMPRQTPCKSLKRLGRMFGNVQIPRQFRESQYQLSGGEETHSPP